MKRLISILFAMTVAALVLGGAAQAASWGGGATGDWTSVGVDNWGLGVGAYPGDGVNDGETHDIGASTVAIQPGDSISTLKIVLLNGATLNMSGGTFLSQSRLQVYTAGQLNLTGGTLTGDTDVRILGDSTITVDGGELGTRLTGIDGVAPPNDMLVSFYGSGTLRVTENGIFDVNRLQYDLLGAGHTGVAEFQGVAAAAFDRSALFVDLFDNDATSATLKFEFSAAGLTPLTQFSNHGLNIGAASRLEVDVSALDDSDGTTAYPLIDYTGDIQGVGTFASVAITDDALGTLSPGTPGSLQPGEYSLDYAHDGGGGDMMIALYFDNTGAAAGPSFTEVALADTLALEFLSVSGTVYDLQFTTDLVSSSLWENAGATLTGTGTNMFFHDPAEATGTSTSRAYRIIQ